MVVVDLADVYISNLGQLHPTCSRAPVYSLSAGSCSPTDLLRKLGICVEGGYRPSTIKVTNDILYWRKKIFLTWKISK
jgi:hypothetical protein